MDLSVNFHVFQKCGLRFSLQFCQILYDRRQLFHMILVTGPFILQFLAIHDFAIEFVHRHIQIFINLLNCNIQMLLNVGQKLEIECDRRSLKLMHEFA